MHKDINFKGFVVSNRLAQAFVQHWTDCIATIDNYRATYGEPSVAASKWQYDNGQIAPMLQAERLFRRDLWAIEHTCQRTLNADTHIVLGEEDMLWWRLHR